MTPPASRRVAVLIVGFQNCDDIYTCITALSRAATRPDFDIFICENGGMKAFDDLVERFAGSQELCHFASEPLPEALASPGGRLKAIRCLNLVARDSRIWLGCAVDNLGYAGGINVWLDRLQRIPGWDAIWVLNPDCAPEPNALAELVRYADSSHKGMVGSSIVSFEHHDLIHCRAGHRWRRFVMRPAIIGYHEQVEAPADLDAILADLDIISGASMYVTRWCLERIGPMDERFFLYFEDADWSFRAKQCGGLGYARASIVPHKGGTTIGSAADLSVRSSLSVYLGNRNRILFVRLHFPLFFPLACIVSSLFALEYIFAGSGQNFRAALEGVVAGIRGETGLPKKQIQSNGFGEKVKARSL